MTLVGDHTRRPVGEVTVRLFDDGGVEMAFDVDDARRDDLLPPPPQGWNRP